MRCFRPWIPAFAGMTRERERARPGREPRPFFLRRAAAQKPALSVTNAWRGAEEWNTSTVPVASSGAKTLLSKFEA